MTVSELIIELAKCEDQNARVIFYYNDGDKTEVAFNVAGRAKPDLEDVQWIKDTNPACEILILE